MALSIACCLPTFFLWVYPSANNARQGRQRAYVVVCMYRFRCMCMYVVCIHVLLLCVLHTVCLCVVCVLCCAVLLVRCASLCALRACAAVCLSSSLCVWGPLWGVAIVTPCLSLTDPRHTLGFLLRQNKWGVYFREKNFFKALIHSGLDTTLPKSFLDFGYRLLINSNYGIGRNYIHSITSTISSCGISVVLQFHSLII